jgi:apolipoprotein D and lipocalin family protein
VLNSCRDEKDGRVREARGRAWSVDPGNARLKVSFFWPFRGDYWIIDLGQDYQYSVVGTPDRKYLWILSRTQSMNPEVLAGILQVVERQGFDRNRLLFP